MTPRSEPTGGRGAGAAPEDRPASPRRARLLAWLRRAWNVLGALAMVAYPLAVYAGLGSGSPRTIALLLLAVLAPTVIARLRAAERRTLRSLAAVPLAVAAALAAAAALDELGLVLAVPAVVNAILLIAFGSTLRGELPMVERFARLQVPDLTPPERAWCRTWTRIWCGFFLLNGLTASALALWAPLSWWALYNGLIAYALIGLLAAVEYVLRKLRFGRFGDGWHERLLARLASSELRTP